MKQGDSMIKAVFIAESDADLGVRTGDTVELEEFEDDYLCTTKSGEKLFVGRWEVEVFDEELVESPWNGVNGCRMKLRQQKM